MQFRRLSPTSALILWEQRDQFAEFLRLNKGEHSPASGLAARWVLPNNAMDLSRWVEVTGAPNDPNNLTPLAVKLEVHRKHSPAMVLGFRHGQLGKWQLPTEESEQEEYRIGHAVYITECTPSMGRPRPPLILPGEE
jgi:hypothetical protein